jgi:branched-subunit amino acid aminotransferase/4-amino-4-deoxychorismate lyase
MDEPLAYLNGQLLPADKAVLPIDDAGFALGATVTEQLRTFGGQLFRVDRHLERLGRSLAVCGLAPEISLDEFGRIARKIADHNHRLLEPGDDLGLAIFVTPGPYPAISSGRRGGLTVGLHTFPLAFGLWAAAYTSGVNLVLTPVEQVSSHCWPPELKCRSRMHYFLADRHAAAIERGARALLLDAAGYVTETATANVVIYKAGEGLVTPPRGGVLPGMSLEAVAELASRRGIPFGERPLLPADIATADEMLLSSTPYGIVPVTRFNGRALGSGQPGPVFARLLAAWNELAGLDIAAQAQRFAARRKSPSSQSTS